MKNRRIQVKTIFVQLLLIAETMEKRVLFIETETNLL